MKRIEVDAGLVEQVVRNPCSEDGETLGLVRCYRVGFSTPYGLEYTHLQAFPDSLHGEQQAQRLARRVQAAMDASGMAALNTSLWATRTIYGSEAYCDQEPEIVQREEDDALEAEFFQRR